MKLFNGLYKYTYQTLFGKIELRRTEQGVQFIQHDEPRLGAVAITVCMPSIRQMRFNSRREAFIRLRELEKNSMQKLEELLQEIK